MNNGWWFGKKRPYDPDPAFIFYIKDIFFMLSLYTNTDLGA